MLAATGGVNTHRGAIFMLGSAVRRGGRGRRPSGAPMRPARCAPRCNGIGATRWAARVPRPPTLPGGIAARRHGLRSASQEAALGFPVLFETAVPAWVARTCATGSAGARLQLQVFFEIMAVLDDSNLAHRGGAGRPGVRTRAGARLPGAAAARRAPEALDDAWAIHRAFVARRLSPGGCADTLSAACFLDRLGAIA